MPCRIERPAIASAREQIVDCATGHRIETGSNFAECGVGGVDRVSPHDEPAGGGRVVHHDIDTRALKKLVVVVCGGVGPGSVADANDVVDALVEQSAS